MDAAAGDGDSDANQDAGPTEGHDASQSDSSDGGTPLSADQKLAKAMYDKMISCGVVSGVSAARPYNIGTAEDDTDRCVGNCILAAPCSELNGLLCGNEGNDFAVCVGNCPAVPDDGFHCGDPANTVIPHFAVCDQDREALRCPNGRDEDPAVCADKLFVCDDGDKVSKNFVCNGSKAKGNVSVGGCKDGSDENCCAVVCGQDHGCK